MSRRRKLEKETLRRGHRRRLALSVLVAVGGLVAALVAFLALRPGSSEAPGPPRAAIVDQLSLSSPNSAFVQEATSMLEGAGYAVDYYPGDQVTIELYRGLPRHHYEMVILRVHSARFQTSDGTLTDDVVLFTGEPYDRQKNVEDRKAGYLARARYFLTDPVSYFFGVTARFVESKMKGDFEGATVILMGCDGLRSNTMAGAFVGRGAKAFISWDDLVSTNHTDAATESLLRYLLIEKRTPSEAVAQTMTEVGPDPSYGSKLLLYPAEAAAGGP